MDGWMDRRMGDGWMDRLMHEWMDGQMEIGNLLAGLSKPPKKGGEYNKS